MVQTDPRLFPLNPIKNKCALLQWQKKIHSEKGKKWIWGIFKSFIFTQNNKLKPHFIPKKQGFALVIKKNLSTSNP